MAHHYQVYPHDGRFWFTVLDTYGDALIVSPAIYGTEGRAADAAQAQIDTLARLSERLTAPPLDQAKGH